MIVWLWSGIFCYLIPKIVECPDWLTIILTIGWFVCYFGAYITWDLYVTRVKEMRDEIKDLKFRIRMLEIRKEETCQKQ